MATMVDTYRQAYKACEDLVKKESCGPILVRLAWHDSGNYDAKEGTGGATGSIRFDKEQAHGGNAGLKNALALMEPIKKLYPTVSYADLFQMGSAAAIAVAGGPVIPMKYGRVDAASDKEVPIEGRLPAGGAPFHKANGADPASNAESQEPADHLRAVFYRMGLEDVDIVALSGAHTIGRAHKDRSGACPMASTKFTKDGPGSKKGGMSWTPEWQKFDNSYFKILVESKASGKSDEELLQLSTDKALLEDPAFRPIAEKFANDQDEFFKAYSASHKKLSELGSKFDPTEGFTI
mmetsp:Transcript_14231/g.27314  ORF Transcript_14231/g.27314 Transcript_14231/m.27314 type:complete len:293 (+) Transcript_14231:172-1050(+)